jgi:hypothetical protein
VALGTEFAWEGVAALPLHDVVGTLSRMAKARTGDVTIRLKLEERRRFEVAAARQHLPLSTWLRRVAHAAAEREALFDEGERRRRVAQALAALDAHPAPAGDLARRRAGWSRKP